MIARQNHDCTALSVPLITERQVFLVAASRSSERWQHAIMCQLVMQPGPTQARACPAVSVLDSNRDHDASDCEGLHGMQATSIWQEPLAAYRQLIIFAPFNFVMVE